MNNKYKNKYEELLDEKKNKPVKLMSEYYNHNNEKIVRREEVNKDKVKWVFAIGVGLIIVFLIILIIFI